MPATPVRTRTTSAASNPINTSGRKVPHCKKCHQPRLGHPRTGCPKPLVQPEEGSSDVEQDVDDHNLNDALRSVGLNAPDLSPQRSAKARRSSEILEFDDSIASFSSDDEAIIAQLKRPASIEPDSDGEHLQQKDSRVKKWVAGVSRHDSEETEVKKFEHGHTMPCTLSFPGSSFDSDGEGTPQAGSSQDLASAVASTVKSKGRALTRTMSAEERSMLFHNLNHLSASPPASLYTLPKSEVEEMQAAATKLGFTTLVIAHIRDEFSYLVVGKDAKAVDALYEGLKGRMGGVEVLVVGNNKKGPGYSLRAVAGSAIMGAAATFAGLAYV